MILVLGIDAATWSVIKPNLQKLKNFTRLCHMGEGKELVIDEALISASIWCTMFSGKTTEEHGHRNYVVNGNIVKRENLKVDFIWDIAEREGKKAIALNVPFVVPPYSFGADFRPVGFGLPTNEREWQEELDQLTEKVMESLREKPDLLIAVFTLLDRIQHFHWGEEFVVEWYEKLDMKIGEILFKSGFLDNRCNKLIMVSDHGFCSFGEAKIQTLPLKTEYGELKGDHSEIALLITSNIEYQIAGPRDVFAAIKKHLG